MSDFDKNNKTQPHGGHDHHGHHHHSHPDPLLDSNEGLDPASKALAEALRLSFMVLKVVMICVIAFFIYRGFYWVEQNQVALELRFGTVKGGESRSAILQPGPHWAWPYPVEEVVVMPSELAERELTVEDFWYFDPQAAEREAGMASSSRIPQTLRFGTDGYSLTASSSVATWEDEQGDVGPVTDYNVIHSKWRIRYRVTSPIRFFREVWYGQKDQNGKYDWTSTESYLRTLLSDAIIVTSANWDIEGMWGHAPGRGASAFSNAVEQAFSQSLARRDIGVTVQLNLIDWTPPRQVQGAFEAASRATDQRDELKQGANAEAAEIVNNARADAAIIVAQSEAYSTRVTEAAAADSENIRQILDRIDLAVEQRVPETVDDFVAERGRVRDELLAVTVDELYQEAIRDVIGSSDETFVLNSSNGAPVEWRPILSRDATLSPRAVEDEDGIYMHTPIVPGAAGGPGPRR